MLKGPDAGLRFAVITITLVSMGFTAFFGWLAGGEYLFFSIVGAIGLATISALSPLLWGRVSRLQGEGKGLPALVLAVFAGLFLTVDAITNIGSVFAMRQTEIVGTENQNTNATNIRNEVARLEKRIGEIRAQESWRTTYLAPDAYDGLIAAATLIRDNEAKRGGCGPLCEQKTKELADLQANKANAEHRLALKAEMKQLERELVEAKAAVTDTPTVVSAAWTQVEKLTSLATLSLDPTEDMKGVGYLIITGILGVVMAIAPAIGAWALGHSNSYVPRETPTVSQNPWLGDHRPADARHLHAETVTGTGGIGGAPSYHNSTAYVVPGSVADVDWDTMKSNISESMRMAEMAQAILKRKTPESA